MGRTSASDLQLVALDERGTRNISTSKKKGILALVIDGRRSELIYRRKAIYWVSIDIVEDFSIALTIWPSEISSSRA